MHRVAAGLQPEILHCLNSLENLAGGMDLTVLERQRGRMKLQEQSQQCCFDNSPLTQNQFHSLTQSVIPASDLSRLPEGSVLQEMVNLSTSRVKTGPGLEIGWMDFGKFQICNSLEDETSNFGFVAPKLLTVGERGSDSGTLGYAISRTASCPSNFPAGIEEKLRDPNFSDKVATLVPKGSFKKRKAERGQRTDVSNTRSLVSEEFRDKRIKGDTEVKGDEVDSKGAEQNNYNNQRESSGDTAKENSKVSEVQKPDYIHVRARRGQATDSHSLAERVRREKISERMKYLQDLVPGCNKITGKAGMLDEIINYVQSLQRQVEFLSMKLAAVNPRPDFNVDDFYAKEMFPACNNSFPAIGILPELATASYLQFNSVQPGSLLCGMDMAINPPDISVRRTTSPSVSVPDQFIDSCFHAHGSSSTLDSDLQSLYNVEFSQGRPHAFPAPAFPGNLEVNNLKLEM